MIRAEILLNLCWLLGLQENQKSISGSVKILRKNCYHQTSFNTLPKTNDFLMSFCLSSLQAYIILLW